AEEGRVGGIQTGPVEVPTQGAPLQPGLSGDQIGMANGAGVTGEGTSPRSQATGQVEGLAEGLLGPASAAQSPQTGSGVVDEAACGLVPAPDQPALGRVVVDRVASAAQ